MSDKIVTLEEFVANATTVLLETENNLQKLAHTALSHHEQLRSDQENGQEISQTETTVRLQQIGHQLAKLSQRSKSLQTYLQNGFDTPPTDDDHWPRIRILQSHEEERTQIAHELEDTVGQLLANAVFELASCQHLLASDKDAVSEGLKALQHELEQGLTAVRHFIADLEPTTVLGNFGLGGGTRRYLEQFEAQTKIKTQLQVHTNIGRLPSIIEIAIFRIIQEALQNVRHHANASQVDVTFEEKETMLKFSIIDNGDGLVADRIDISRKNFGLARMVDYAELLNGKLKIYSNLKQGTQVVLLIPHQSL